MAKKDVVGQKEEVFGIPTPSGAEAVKLLTDSPPDLVEALQRVEVFAGLPAEQLEWFVAQAQEYH